MYEMFFFYVMLKILHHYFLSAFSSIFGKHDTGSITQYVNVQFQDLLVVNEFK